MEMGQEASTGLQTLTRNQQPEDSNSPLRELLRRNRLSRKGGIYAVCSAHPAVIEAAVRQSLEDGSALLVESTSSQVNQFGGYSGLTPGESTDFVYSTAKKRRTARGSRVARRILRGALPVAT